MTLRDIVRVLIQVIVIMIYSLRIQPMIDNFWIKWLILFILLSASNFITDWIMKNFK